MVQADVRSTLEVCGEVTAAAHSTATSAGGLTVGGNRYVLRAGTDLDAAVQAGAFLKLRLSTDVVGEVADVTVLRASTSLAAACGSAAPGPSDGPAPTGDPEASDDASQSADPSPSVPAGHTSGGADGEAMGDEVLGETESNCESDAAEAVARAPDADRGGLIPDTASLGRVGSVLVVSAVPFALLLLALGGWAIQRRLREVAP